MADPITLAALGGVVLTEGVKFMYGQVSKILERRAARKEAAEKEAGKSATEPVDVQLPAEFHGQLNSPTIDFEQVERELPALLELRPKLMNYGEGLVKVDPNNQDLVADIDALRQILESIYGQKITFKGEDGEPSGTTITTRARVGRVLGRFTGTTVEDAQRVKVDTTLDIDEVGPDGVVEGTRARNLK